MSKKDWWMESDAEVAEVAEECACACMKYLEGRGPALGEQVVLTVAVPEYAVVLPCYLERATRAEAAVLDLFGEYNSILDNEEVGDCARVYSYSAMCSGESFSEKVREACVKVTHDKLQGKYGAVILVDEDGCVVEHEEEAEHCIVLGHAIKGEYYLEDEVEKFLEEGKEFETLKLVADNRENAVIVRVDGGLYDLSCPTVIIAEDDTESAYQVVWEGAPVRMVG